MRLRDLDAARWAAIADDISALADEIAEDPHPDIPLEELPEPTEAEWPDDSMAVAVWRDLTRAATLALFLCADPTITMSAGAELLRTKGEE